MDQSYAYSEFCHHEIEFLASLFVKGKKVSHNILFLTIESLLLSPGKHKSTLRVLRLLKILFNMFAMRSCIYLLYVYFRNLYLLECLL